MVGATLRFLAHVALLVWLAVPPATHAQEQVPAPPPFFRLWAPREGLVGKPPAGGHLITPNDHFVALPSRKALNKNVIVSYKGKTVTAPVLDIGPWNRDEAWWET